MSRRLTAAAFVSLLCSACNGSMTDIDAVDSGTATTTDAAQGPQLEAVDDAAVASYAERLAPVLVGRVVSAQERASLLADGEAALPAMFEAWADEDGFVEAARTMMEMLVGTSGRTAAIDFDLPGNLVTHVVRNDRPWAEILTSPTCYDDAGSPRACDTGAPYTAGILTTRAFLSSHHGRFNLTRSKVMMSTFACRDYPQEPELQPHIARERLLPLFRAATREEQMEAAAAGGFGNGFACYACHGQFSLHAQLFVAYDTLGVYRSNFTGLQNPEGELGESTNGLMTSHLVDPAEAASERSSIFGRDVANLAEAAAVLTDHPVFLQCAAKNLMRFGLDLDDARGIQPSLLASIQRDAETRNPQPTLRDLLVATFAHPVVVRTVTSQMSGGAQ